MSCSTTEVEDVGVYKLTLARSHSLTQPPWQSLDCCYFGKNAIQGTSDDESISYHKLSMDELKYKGKI